MALVTLSTSDVFKDGTGTPIANGVLVLALLGPQNPEVLFTGLHAQRIASFTLNASGQLTGTPQIYGSDQLDSNEIYFWEVFRDSTLLAPVAAVGPLTGQLLNTTDSQPVSLLNHPAAGGSPVITAQGFPAGNPTTQVLPLPPTVLQPKNTVLAGPTSGADAPATFRSLVTADLPSSAALKPATTDAIQYVTTGGNDLNDGLSWGSAKATVPAAAAAIFANSANGGTVYVGAGTFSYAPTDYSSHLNISNNVTASLCIIGQGPGVTIIQANAGGSMFKAHVANTFWGMILKNLTLDGNNKTGVIGLDFLSINGFYLENLEFIHFDTNCMKLNACIGGSGTDLLMQKPNGTACIGIFLTPTGGGVNTHLTFTNLDTENMSAGIQTDSSTSASAISFLELKSPICENGIDGIVITNGSDITIVDCDLEANSGVPLRLGDTALNASANCSLVQIIGGFAQTSATYAGLFDKTIGIHFEQFAAHQVHITSNARMVGGSLSVGVTPQIDNLTVLDPNFRYATSVNWIFPSTQGIVSAGPLTVAGATPTGATGTLSLGNTAGFGNGTSGTAVTTTTKNTGTGPTIPQTVVNYIEIDIAGTKFWIPLVQ